MPNVFRILAQHMVRCRANFTLITTLGVKESRDCSKGKDNRAHSH